MERLEPKAPGEIRNYRFDWVDYLGTDIISSSDVQVAGVTLDSQTHDDTSVTVRLSGGTERTVAYITNTITTAGGLQESELFTLLIATASEPVSLNEAKQQLRIVDETSEDELIAGYIRSARAYVESESGYVFVRRQFTDSFNRWPAYLNIARRPLISVDEIAYLDSAGVPQTVASSDYYTALALRRVTPVGIWPAGSAVSVTYTAGFAEGDSAEELELARQAILLLVGHWFANRETVSIDNATPLEVPFAARALIDRFRTVTV